MSLLDNIKSAFDSSKTKELDSIGVWLAGPAWEAMKAVVAAMESTTLPGEEKKKTVIKTLESLGYSLAGLALNCAIEVAVVLITSKVGELKK